MATSTSERTITPRTLGSKKLRGSKMNQIIIPNLKKLNLVIPNAVFELYQQMKRDDSLSFTAIGSRDKDFHVSVKKQGEVSTAIDIEALGSGGVLDLCEDEWQCEIQAITSEAFLLQGGAALHPNHTGSVHGLPQGIESPNLTEDTTEENSLTTTSEGALLTLSGESQDEDHKLSSPGCVLVEPVAHMSPVSGGGSVTQHSVTIATTPQVNLVKSESVQDTEQLVIREDAGEVAESYTEEAVEPTESANEESFHAGGDFKIEQVETEEIDNEDNLIDSMDTTEIILGKNKKVLLICGHTSTVIRAAAAPCERGMQACAQELAGYEVRPEDSLDLDACLTDTASASQQAEGILHNILEKSAKKLIDPNTSMEKFPIIKEGEKYKCHMCGLLLLQRSYLVCHMRYVHKICVRDPLALFRCPHCDETFVRKNRLKEHVLHHHMEEKPHSCDMEGCDMTFKTIYNLRDHKRIFHYHMLRYACDVCEKQYENPNTMVRHRKSCAQRRGSWVGKDHKEAEQLRNPHWIPVNELFNTVPRQRPSKRSAGSSRKTGKPSSLVKYVRRKETEKKTGNVDEPSYVSDEEEENENSEDEIPENAEKDSGPDDGLEAGEVEPLVQVTSVMGGRGTAMHKLSAELSHTAMGKRKVVWSSEEENSPRASPEKRTMMEAVLGSDRKSRRLAGQDKVDYKRMATSADHIPHTQTPSVHIQQTPTTQQTPSNHTSLQAKTITKSLYFPAPESSGVYIESTEKTVKTPLSFQVQGVLHHTNTYTLSHSELCRRLYGPETMNPVAFMSFIKKTEGCSKILEFKKMLLAHGYKVPKFTNVTTCFSKLSEAEIADVVVDLVWLQKEYLPADRLCAAVLGDVGERCAGNHTQLAIVAQHVTKTREFLAAVRDVLLTAEVTCEFTQVTHGFGPAVLRLFVELFQAVLEDAAPRIHGQQSSSPQDEDNTQQPKSTGYAAGSPGKEKAVFSVPGMLSVSSTTYEVSVEEVQRRTELPEQMALTLLHTYLRKGKSSYSAVIEECEEHGLVLQKGNRTWVQSCFSRLVEAEARELCEDLREVLYDHCDREQMAADVVSQLDKTRHNTAALCHSVSLVQPYIQRAVENSCKDFNLVTHTLGGALTLITWKFTCQLANTCKEYCKNIAQQHNS